MAVPMMPRSSSGVFHAVFRPWDWVKTPPSGGPTSWPKTSVTPRRSSPTCSARRIAWTTVAIRRFLPRALGVGFRRAVSLGKYVLPDVFALRLRLVADALARVEQLLRVLASKRVHRLPCEDPALLELVLEENQAIGLVGDEVGTGRRRMAIQARDHGFEKQGPALGAHVVHGLLQLSVRDLGIVSVDEGGLDSEGLGAIDDVLRRELIGRQGGYAPPVVGHDHQARELVTWARAPKEARREVTLRRPRVA